MMKEHAQAVFKVIKQAVSDFVQDDAIAYAAALAFYTALAFAPLLLLFISISSMLGDDTQQRMIEQFREVLGSQAGEAVNDVVQNADSKSIGSGTLGTVVSGVVLLFSASGVFAQFQKALNHIWDVAPKPGAGVMGWLRKRLLSIGMLLSMAFIFVASLVATTVISAIMPDGGMVQSLIELGVSLAIFILLFALMFKFLPDVRIAWREVWGGAIGTALLFALGKFGIGIYLGHSSTASAYGAAGSLILLLVWMYFSAMIVLFGAEMTQAYSRLYGRGIEPDKHAIREDRKDVALA